MENIRNIKSIQIFNLVVEERSITKAAQILNISQSSVSYHIKKLEEDLGTTLVHRNSSGVEPTEEGLILATHVQEGLAAIQTGLERLSRRSASVRVALLPMFASRWFSSRLENLLKVKPRLQLSIQSHGNSYTYMKNPESLADLGIQWGRGDWPEFDVTRLWPEKLVVVCSPGYLKTHRIEKPKDLERCTLLHVDDFQMWDEWFAGNGLALPDTPSQITVEDRHFQLSSTINGLGVSLFASWIVEHELRRGDLVNPFSQAFDTRFAYHLVIPKKTTLTEPGKRFVGWIMDQCDGAPS